MAACAVAQDVSTIELEIQGEEIREWAEDVYEEFQENHEELVEARQDWLKEVVKASSRQWEAIDEVLRERDQLYAEVTFDVAKYAARHVFYNGEPLFALLPGLHEFMYDNFDAEADDAEHMWGLHKLRDQAKMRWEALHGADESSDDEDLHWITFTFDQEEICAWAKERHAAHQAVQDEYRTATVTFLDSI